MPLFLPPEESLLITALPSVETRPLVVRAALVSIVRASVAPRAGFSRICSRIARQGALLLGVLVCFAATAPDSFAAPSACPAFFVAGQAPDVLRMEQVPRSHMLCFHFYSAMASGITHTPLWSAERLTRDSVAAAQTQKRHDAFHAEMGIVADDRSELEDYRASGFDRGHMSPSADMPDAASQEQSFSLANMVPQDANNNRHLWQGIEITTRAMAKSSGELYVVSGPAFVGAPTWVHSRVAVPDYLWKAIYDPKRGAAAYLTGNRDGDGYAVVSIAMLQRITGIDPFPGLSTEVKAQAIALPPPRPSGQRMKTGPVSPTALGLVFPSDGGTPQTTLPAPQPDDKVAQREARSEKKASSTATATSALVEAGLAATLVQHHRKSEAKQRRAAKRREKKAEQKATQHAASTMRPTAAKSVPTPHRVEPKHDGSPPAVYGYGYRLGKTLKQLGNDLTGHGK